MDSRKDPIDPKRLSEMTDEELLQGIADAIAKPADCGKESAAEYLERKAAEERSMERGGVESE